MAPETSELRAIAETAFRALNANDLDSFLTVVADDVEFTSMILEMEGVTFRGHDGVRTWWDTVRDSFQGVHWELLDLVQSDHKGIAKLRAAANLGGGRVDQLVWQAAPFSDGQLTWWAFFRSEKEAREAGGLG